MTREIFMAYYSYKARSADGKTVKGLVEAPGTQAAVRLLREKQMVVLSLNENKGGMTITSAFSFLQRVKFSDIVNFTRQLSTMLVSGLTIPDSLTILRAQTTNPIFSQVLLDIEHQIVAGGALADCLAKYPQYFTPSYIALIRAGEASGTLDKVLIRVADTLEAQQEFKSKVQGALIYPAIIFFAMIGMTVLMMVVVVPKMSELYKEFNLKLPASTQFLIAVSNFMIHFWWLLIPMIFGAVVLFGYAKRTPVGDFLLDSFLLKLPLFGDLRKKTLMVEFTRTLAMLIGSGIHILEGMRILQGALDSIVFRSAIFEISQKIEKGFPLGDTFGQYEIFPPIVVQMMKVGEETGKLDETLNKMATYFQSETEHMVKGLTTAIEPIIMVVMGLGVGFLVFSIIMPIFQLTQAF